MIWRYVQISSRLSASSQKDFMPSKSKLKNSPFARKKGFSIDSFFWNKKKFQSNYKKKIVSFCSTLHHWKCLWDTYIEIKKFSWWTLNSYSICKNSSRRTPCVKKCFSRFNWLYIVLYEKADLMNFFHNGWKRFIH